MRKRLPFAALLGGLVLGAASVSPASALTVCGVNDNGPGDSDERDHFVTLTCTQPQGRFIGSVLEVKDVDINIIAFGGDWTGNGSMDIESLYNLGTWIGPRGMERAEFLGGLRPWDGAKTGSEFYKLVVEATTFSNNPAGVVGNPASFVNRSNTKRGEFGGPGTVTGVMTWNVGSLTMDGKGKFVVSVSPVPEPETWALLVSGFGCAGAILRRRRRSAPALA